MVGFSKINFMHPRYKDKKIALVGMSVEGYDSLLFFIEQGALVTCCDRRSLEDLSVPEKFKENSQITWQTGSSYLNNLNSFDLIVRSPGVSLYLAEFIVAQKSGVQITSLTKLFFEHCKAPIIGVTGTKGKGTTSTLIAHIFSDFGKKVFLGGNVGQPLLSKVSKIKPSDWVVLELSSFQLEDLTQSPHIAVVLKITEDHLRNMDPLASNFHPSRDQYLKAKMPIVLYQKKYDFVIFNGSDHSSSSFAKYTKAKRYIYGYNKSFDAGIENNTVWLHSLGKVHQICQLSQIQLRGSHNLENVAAATLSANAAGIPVGVIVTAVRQFKPLEHRLEFTKTVGGVDFYNDSFSTTPQTSVAALESFSEPIVLIAGGSDKGLDYNEFAEKLFQANIRAVVLIGQIGLQLKDLIVKTAQRRYGKKIPFTIIVGGKNMKEIVDQAWSISQTGDVVLLSPATASFGMFKNYKERGFQFKQYVEKIKTKTD